MDQVIKDLVSLCHVIGADPAYVQGGGGNVSLKTSDGLMAIKASGMLLKRVTSRLGIAVVDAQSINEDLDAGTCRDEQSYNETVLKYIQAIEGLDSARPSMETGFHAVLGPCVLHTHSIYINVLTCSKEGRKWAQEHFKRSVWIPYCNPGLELTLKINATKKAQGVFGDILFLQNHGIIIVGDNWRDALEKHEAVNQTIREKLSLSQDLDIRSHDFDLNLLRKQVLFPDQVVYVNDPSFKDSMAAQETLSAYFYILSQIKQLNWNPQFLSQEAMDYIANMDSEKHRKKIGHKDK